MRSKSLALLLLTLMSILVISCGVQPFEEFMLCTGTKTSVWLLVDGEQDHMGRYWMWSYGPYEELIHWKIQVGASEYKKFAPNWWKTAKRHYCQVEVFCGPPDFHILQCQKEKPDGFEDQPRPEWFDW